METTDASVAVFDQIMEAPDLETQPPEPPEPSNQDGDNLPERDWTYITVLVLLTMASVLVTYTSVRKLYQALHVAG